MADQALQPPPYTLGFAGEMSGEQMGALNSAFMQLPKEIRDAIGYSDSFFSVSSTADRHHFDPSNPKVIILRGNVPPHQFAEKLINPVVGYGLYRTLHADVPVDQETLRQAVEEHCDWNMARTPGGEAMSYRAHMRMRDAAEQTSSILSSVFYRTTHGETLPEGSKCKEIYDRFIAAARSKTHSLDKTPFKHSGPRIATHQALVLTPTNEMLGIGESANADVHDLRNLRYALATFEPEHCKDLDSFKARLRQERQRFRDSHIASPVREHERYDAEEYFERFEREAETLFQQAHEKIRQLSSHPQWSREVNPALVQQIKDAYARWPEDERTVIDHGGVIISLQNILPLEGRVAHNPEGGYVLVDSGNQLLSAEDLNALKEQAIGYGMREGEIVVPPQMASASFQEIRQKWNSLPSRWTTGAPSDPDAQPPYVALRAPVDDQEFFRLLPVTRMAWTKMRAAIAERAGEIRHGGPVTQTEAGFPEIIGGSAADHVKFKEIFAKWPEMERKAILSKGIRFVIANGDAVTHAEDDGTVIVNRQDLYQHINPQHKHSFLNAALFSLAASKLQDVDWERFNDSFHEEMARMSGTRLEKTPYEHQTALGLIEAMGGNTAVRKLYFQDVYARYKQAVQDAIAEQKVTWYPQVVTDDAKYGHVSADEIEQFKKIYRESWPQQAKNVIEASGLTFALGRFGKKPQPLDPDSKIVRFDCDLLNTKYMASTAIYNALLTACADKMQGVNWPVVASELRGIVAEDMPQEWKSDPATLLVSAKYQMNQIGERAFSAQYPKAYAALQPIWQAMDQANGKNGTEQYIEARKVRENELQLIHYKDADAAVDDTPFTLQGPRIATHQALVLTPQGLVPLANAVKVPTNNAMNIRYAMAIFEPEHCKDDVSFAKRLEEEQRRFKASKIILRDEGDPTKVIDTDKYFEKFSNGAIQLYALAAEYNAALSKMQDAPIDMEKLKANILEHGAIQPVWVRKKDDNRYTLLWGDNLRRAYEELDNEQAPMLLMNEKPIVKQPLVSNEKIRRFEEEYGKWSDNLRAVTEHAGLIYLLDGAKVFCEQERYAKVSADSRTVGINTGIDDSIAPTVFGIVQDHARTVGLIHHDVDTTSLWARSRQELKEKVDELPKSWLIKDYLGAKMASGIGAMVNARQQPDEYRKQLGFSYIADQRSSQIVDEVAERIRTGRKLLRADPHATSFVVNSEKLTEPQQKYFDHLNKIISLVGATPKEFDDAFRFAVKHHQLALMAVGESPLKRELGELYTFQNFARFGTVDRFETADYKFKRRAGKRKLDESEVRRDLQTVQKSAGDYSGALDNCFGYINSTLPSNPTATEQAVFAQPLLSPLSDDKRRKVEPLFFSTEENVLQLYAQGTNDLAVLRSVSQHGKIAHVEYDDPSLDRMFTASVYNAAVGLVKRKGLSEEVDQAVKRELAEMDKLKPQLFLTKSELEAQHAAEIGKQAQERDRQAREAAAATALAQRQAAEAERRRQAAEEEAKQPKPYPSVIGMFSRGSDSELTDEAEKLCAAMDCRMGDHKRLGDALFSGSMLQLVIAVASRQDGRVKAALDEGKNRGITQALQGAKVQVERALMLKGTDMTPEQWERHQMLTNTLFTCPVLLSCISGNRQTMDKSRGWETDEEKRFYIEEELLPELGIVLNGAKQEPPQVPPLSPPPADTVSPAAAVVTSTGIGDTTSPPADMPVVPPHGTEKEPPLAGVIPLVPVAAAGAAALTETPAPVTPPAGTLPEQEVKPPVKEPEAPDTPPVDAGKVDTPPPIVTETVAVPLATVLQDDPRLPTAELDRRRAQAYQAMAKQLAMDAENAGIRALEDGYDQFRCDLLLDKTHARIRLLFQSEDASKPPREEIFDLNSNQYIGGYARLGVVPTTLDALNLRIIVNGEIAADGDFLPILSKTGSGKPRVGKNDFIPNLAIHPDKRETRVNVSNTGMYQLELTSRFTKNGDDVTITFPLGIKEDRADESKGAEARAIAETRGKIVTDFIDGYNDKAAKRRKIPVKGEIQEHLETEVRNIRNVNTTDPAGQWAYPDRIELLVSDGLKHHYLKLVDPLYEASAKTAKQDEPAKKERQAARDAIPRVVVYDDEWKESLAKAGEHQYREVKIPIATLDEHPPEGQQQVTTLGAIALNKKGSNRTYHLDFNIHVNDGTVKTKRREHTAGYNIRGRSLNLCIEDPEIARSRAQEALFGNKNVLGFVDMVMNYFSQRPQARWALDAIKNGGEETTKKQLAANLEKEAKAVLGDEPVKVYRQMVKNELPIATYKRRLNVVREEPQHGMVAIRARIEEKQPDKSYALAKGADNKDLEIVFSVPEKQADLVERFARGDMDGVRLDVLINDFIPRFEHDLSVKMDQGEVKEGKIPVTFSVMRGRRDGKLEQHLDRQGRPARMRLLVPEQQREFIGSADPDKDALAETVDKHVGLLGAIHYSPITPVRPFSDTLRYQELQAQYEQAKKERDGFIDQTHPDFNPDLPKRWLEHAVTSNMRYHLPDISDVQVLREVRNGHANGGGGNGRGKPNSVRERFPSELQALREDSLYPQDSFMERVDKEPRAGFGRRI